MFFFCEGYGFEVPAGPNALRVSSNLSS